jgi:hypothetical protein
MKKITNLFNLNNIIKILIIFSVGFISRIIIYHYLDINVFSEYTNNISILYYFGLSTFSVYFDQLFSYQYSSPINVEPINNKIKFFNNNSEGSIILTKDSTLKLPLHHKIRCKLSWYSLDKGKNTFATYEEYKLIWDSKGSVWIEFKNLVKWSIRWIDNKPTGNLDPRWSELAEETKRSRHFYEWKRRGEYSREYNEKMTRHRVRFGIKK